MDFKKPSTYLSMPEIKGKKLVFNAGAEASLEYAEPSTRVQMRIELLVSPFGIPFVPIEIMGTNLNKVLSSLSWIKDRNNPGGVLAFELVPDNYLMEQIAEIINKYSLGLYSKIWNELGPDIENFFKPMTLIQLWINGYHVMTGNLRSCHRSSSVSERSREVSYSILVDELGHLYSQPAMTQNTVYSDVLKAYVADSDDLGFATLSYLESVPLSTAISKLFFAFLTKQLPSNVTLSDGLPAFLRMINMIPPIGALSGVSLLNYVPGATSIFQTHSDGGGVQSFWDYIKAFVPAPWMELFTESGGRTIVTGTVAPPSVLFPGFNYTVLRGVPYSNPLTGIPNPAHIASTLLYDLNALSLIIGGDFIIITDDMIHNKTLGYDCVNQKTVFHVHYGSGPQFERPIKSTGPLNPFASGGVPTFGVRDMFESFDAANYNTLGIAGQLGSKVLKDIVGPATTQTLANLLALWFRNQSRFREGTVTTKIIPYARAGMYCLYLPSLSGKKVENLRDIGLYYIDSLSHEYGLSDDSVEFTTTLNLIRGTPIPASIAQTALLLFDWETLPPMSGLFDGEYRILQALRAGISIPGVG